MSIDTTTREVVHPITGEITDLAEISLTELVEHVQEVDDLILSLSDMREQLTLEGARRMDKRNERTVRLDDGRVLKTNAPQSESYAVATTRAALEQLIEEDVLDESVLETVIYVPPPPEPVAPQPKVQVREINKLKKHPDERVAKLLGAVRILTPNRRTFKVERP